MKKIVMILVLMITLNYSYGFDKIKYVGEAGVNNSYEITESDEDVLLVPNEGALSENYYLPNSNLLPIGFKVYLYFAFTSTNYNDFIIADNNNVLSTLCLQNNASPNNNYGIALILENAGFGWLEGENDTRYWGWIDPNWCQQNHKINKK